MPIYKNATIGKHKDATVVEFGTGDIAVSSGYDKDKPEIKTLGLSQDKPKPVEEYNKDMKIPGGNSDGLENIVILKFSRIESVDVVIERLNRVRKDLLQETPPNKSA